MELQKSNAISALSSLQWAYSVRQFFGCYGIQQYAVCYLPQQLGPV